MNVNKPDDNGIKVSVALSEVPVRNAVVTLMGGTQSLTYGISATSLSDRGWQLLFLHGFPDINQPDGAKPRTVFMSEPHEVREFRDRVATIIVTLTAIPFLWFMWDTVRKLLRRRGRPEYPLLLALLIFFLLNGVTEGWLFFAGSMMFPLFWLTCAAIQAAPERKDKQ